MNLRKLDAQFLRYVDANHNGHVDTLEAADGVMFQCPLCAQGKETGEEDGRQFVRGAHYVICWFVGKAPDGATPGPGRWIPSGSGLDDLTFIGPAAASVLLNGGCGWHGFIRNGEATLS